MRYHIIFLSILFNLIIASNVLAYEMVVEFSATAIQKAPGRPDYQRKMYIAKNQVRTESVFNNVQLIEIVKIKKQERIVLLPEHKVYMQQQNNNPAMQEVAESNKDAKPCDGLANTSCVMLAKEIINERPTEKWEFKLKQDEQERISLHWIDVEHRMIVREFMPDGTVMELIPKGVEMLNGRSSEKWLWQLLTSDGQTRTSTQWYDPELKMTIREEIEGGYIREISDIKIGSHNNELFEIPPGYKRVEDIQEYIASQQTMANPE